MTVDLSKFNNSWYSPGRSRVVKAFWFLFGLPLLRCAVMPCSGFRVSLLRLVGARVGRGVVIRPGVRVKYPWLLSIGAHSWIGEDVWIDNVAPVAIGQNVCISQAAYLCTGNHDWADMAFGLVVRPINVGDGAWIGARCTVCPGVTVGRNAVTCVGAVVGKEVPPGEIHAGNPAKFVRQRHFRVDSVSGSEDPVTTQ